MGQLYKKAIEEKHALEQFEFFSHLKELMSDDHVDRSQIDA